MIIPPQLTNLGLKFIKLQPKSKSPLQNMYWQIGSFEEIQKHFPSYGNYGVMCGSEIRVLDDDTPQKLLINLFHENFEETFEVRDHIYFKFDNENEEKIIFNHPTLLFLNKQGNLDSHMGELQGKGQYVVGPNSIHPSGENYEVKKDLPIITISYEKFREVFSPFIKKVEAKVVTEHKATTWRGDNITDIPINNIISFVGLKDVGGGCYQGSHPTHGSSNGMNFRIDTRNNTWFCFRCWTGGGPSELIGVIENVISCSSAGSSCYSPDQAREVINLAREKYGLTIPEKQETLSPKGWGRVLNIKTIAEKEDITTCPKCKNLFSFNVEKGFFSCKDCEIFGGLKKLLILSYHKKLKEATIK